MGNGVADCLAKHLSRFHLFKFISEYHAAGVVFCRLLAQFLVFLCKQPTDLLPTNNFESFENLLSVYVILFCWV